MKKGPTFIENSLSKLSIDELWKIIEDFLSPFDDLPDRTTMNYKQIFELCLIIKEADEMFRNIEQIALLQHELDKIPKIHMNSFGDINPKT